MQTITFEQARAWLAPRSANCHKGDFGTVGILGGAPGMAGAALLAGRAALWLGAGKIYCGLLDERVAVDFGAPDLMLTRPEAVLANLEETSPHRTDSPGPSGCLVVGPGLGRSTSARTLLENALESALPLLLDADALNLLAAAPNLGEMLCKRSAPSLLTPHPGEAGRLIGLPSQTIQADRQSALTRLAERFQAGIVLKGAGSLIHFPGMAIWRNDTGNPGMASPGMGDVLAGMIAALAAQGLPLENAAVLGVHLHGLAADHLVQIGTGPLGLTANEVARSARDLLNGNNEAVFGRPISAAFPGY